MDDKYDNNKKKLSPYTLDKFLEVQEREITLKERELTQSTQSREYDHEYALKSLAAQIQDREGMRQHESSNIKYRYGFASLVIIGLFIVFGIAIAHDKDQIVMEIIKAIIFVGAGAFGGYSMGKQKNKPNKSDED